MAVERCRHCLISISAALELTGMSQLRGDSIAEVFFPRRNGCSGQPGTERFARLGWNGARGSQLLPGSAPSTLFPSDILKKDLPAHPAPPNTPACLMGTNFHKAL